MTVGFDIEGDKKREWRSGQIVNLDLREEVV
jgi:hypothetical protein